jgi:hypothetical protein
MYTQTNDYTVTYKGQTPASRQRGRPTETEQQIPDPNSWKGSNIWSKVHKLGSTPRHTEWLTVSHKMTLTLTRGWGSLRWDSEVLLRALCGSGHRVIALQIVDRKFEKATFRQEVISGRGSHRNARHQDILTDWLAVSRKVTSNFEYEIVSAIYGKANPDVENLRGLILVAVKRTTVQTFRLTL